MKRNAIARLIIYSILAIVFTAVLVTGLTADSFYIGFGSTGGTVAEGEIALDASQIRNIQVQWNGGSITVCPGHTNELRFYEILPDGQPEKMTYLVDGDTLKLYETCYRNVFSFGSFAHKQLVITVPADWIGQTLSFNGASLDLQLQEVNAQQLIIDGSSCKLNFTGNLATLDADGSSCKINYHGTANSIEIDGSSCQLHFKGSLSSLDMDGSSAKAYVRSITPMDEISMDGSSVQLELILPQGCGFTAELDGSSAKLHTVLPCVMQDDTYVYGDGRCRIELDGSSCSLTVSESSECVHEWDLGEPVIVPGTNEQQWIFTCLHCGTEEIRDSRCEHHWIMVGSGLIIYRCSLCGEFKNTQE